MTDDNEALTLVAQLADPVETLVLEWLITDSQDLIDEEDIRISVHGNREGQTQEHSRGVELHLIVNEIFDLAEGDDPIELLGRERGKRMVWEATDAKKARMGEMVKS